MARTHKLISCIASLFVSMGSHAYTCQDIPNIIREDITKYADNIKNQHLPWMQLSWLKNELGQPDTQNAEGMQVKYEWRCPKGLGRITAMTDTYDTLVRVHGQYTTASGSGLFAVDIPQTSTQAFNQLIHQIKGLPNPISLFAPPKPSSQKAAQCRKLIHQIYLDTKKHDLSAETISLPWMNINALKKELGKPQKMIVYDYAWLWGEYNLFIGADGSRIEIGTLPNDVHPQHFYEALALLGRPKDTLFDKFDQYFWACPADSPSYLTVWVKKDDMVLSSLKGKDCSENECKLFNAIFSSGKLKQEFEKLAAHSIKLHTQHLTNRLNEYNAHYKTSFHRKDELMTDMTMKIRHYYSNLKTCHPGIYQYPVPISQQFLFHTSIVQQQDKGVCHVNTSYTIPHIGKVIQICQFHSESLLAFTDTEAEITAQGNLPSHGKTTSIIQQECKQFVNKS